MQEEAAELVRGDFIGSRLAEVGQFPHGPRVAVVGPPAHSAQMRILGHPRIQRSAKVRRLWHHDIPCCSAVKKQQGKDASQNLRTRKSIDYNDSILSILRNPPRQRLT